MRFFRRLVGVEDFAAGLAVEDCGLNVGAGRSGHIFKERPDRGAPAVKLPDDPADVVLREVATREEA